MYNSPYTMVTRNELKNIVSKMLSLSLSLSHYLINRPLVRFLHPRKSIHYFFFTNLDRGYMLLKFFCGNYTEIYTIVLPYAHPLILHCVNRRSALIFLYM